MSSKHVVFLNLDADSTAVITDYWQKLGLVSEVAPHLTMAVYDKSDTSVRNRILSVVKDFASAFEGPIISFASFGMFPAAGKSVLFMAPIVTSALLDFHKGFHDLSTKEDLSCNDLYKPGNWVPHCTLEERANDQGASEMIGSAFGHLKPQMPLMARLDSIEVLEVGQSVVSLSRYPLR